MQGLISISSAVSTTDTIGAALALSITNDIAGFNATYFADEDISLVYQGIVDGMANYSADYDGKSLNFSTDLLGEYQIKNIPILFNGQSFQEQ